jgi:hypothetical protein
MSTEDLLGDPDPRPTHPWPADLDVHGVDLDATITAMAHSMKDRNSKRKETSEAGLAVSSTLC